MPSGSSCPTCCCERVVNNGKIHNDKQNHRCRDCGRQLVEDTQNLLMDQPTRHLIDKLLLEKIPLAGIARFTEVSESWLQKYVNTKYAAVPGQLNTKDKKKGT